MTACVLTFTSERDAETCHGKQCMENGQHLKLGSSASGMPLCFRMSHCVLPVPFLATALLFFPENLVGSVGSALPSPCAACTQWIPSVPSVNQKSQTHGCCSSSDDPLCDIGARYGHSSAHFCREFCQDHQLRLAFPPVLPTVVLQRLKSLPSGAHT